MGEISVEQLEQSSKSLDVRAGYTRKFLEQQNVSDTDFIEMAGKVGVTASKEDMADDKKLVTKVLEIQKAVSLKSSDSKEGTDGMFGPYTLEKLNAFIEAKTDRKNASADVAADAKGGDDAKKDNDKVDAGERKIDASGNANHVGVDVAGETPKANLDKILTKFPGKSEVVRLAGNGGRQVVIYIPEGFKPDKPVELIYHFHGMHGNWIDVPFPKLDGTGKFYNAGEIGLGSNRISQALSNTRQGNRILVYPLSAGQRGPVGSKAWENGYDSEWMKKGNSTNDDMDALHQETMTEVKKMLGQEVNSPSITLSGHSAGGAALSNAISSGFKANKVKFLDASYGAWASQAYAKAQGKPEFKIYTIKGTDTDNPETRALKDKEDVHYLAVNDVKHGDFIHEYL